VWFPASADQGSDSVKDIRSGAQAVTDASSWKPPDDDLWPRVTA
jgi:histidyl-tRNA synthetase